MGTGTIVDATIISAPSSTKNATKQRDPEMHQTRKGQQWYFGMKAHVGVDSRTRLIHSAVATAANAHDASVLGDLLHGEERRVWGDQAYRGQRHVIREHAPSAQDFTNRRYRHRGVVDEAEKARNRTKSKGRAKVEHSMGSSSAFRFVRCAIAGWTRMPTGCSSPAASPIFTSLEGRDWLRRGELRPQRCDDPADRPNRPANAEFRPQVASRFLRLRHHHDRAAQMAG